ncbi:head-tail connector protein [Nocardiopsis trehalosi]|uniref:head-tail connector protein n=1 Tax=Nocardiopsis trehalosi TaxID=109329 RepID=UPI0008378BDA|nr:head-tail connector protein [Nocardiopsis trehalosi]
MITTEAAPFITVADAKKHLNKVNAASDEEIEGFVAAACAMVVDRIGQVSRVTAAETVTVRAGRALLTHRPVLEVTTPGWTVVNREGIAANPSASGEVELVYAAGREPVPANVRLAALELVAHLWRNSQNGSSGGGRPVVGGADSTVVPGTAYSMPYRVRELLGLGKAMRDEPLVG